MRLPNPRHLYEALKRKARAPETESERSLYVLLHGEKELNKAVPHRPWDTNSQVDLSVQYPYGVFSTAEVRSVLEAFLIATDNNAQISNAIAMPAEEIDIYRTLFFDTTTFRTDLELIIFLQGIPDDESNKNIKALYKIAFHQGLGALRWHFCRDKGQVTPEVVIRSVMTDSYYRSLEHRGQQITSKVAKEASRQARTAMDCARVLLTDQTGNADAEDLRIKFEQARKNRTIDQHLQDNPSEILH
jgi:hypothetical protein